MIVAFTLSMPNVASWNGRWSGEGRCYAIVKTFRSAKFVAKHISPLLGKSFYYSFGDGWGASVEVKEVDRSKAAALRKKSVGFSGYDWMVDSLIDFGEILRTDQQSERRAAELGVRDESKETVTHAI